MKKKEGQVMATPLPDGTGHVISYEQGHSRKTIVLSKPVSGTEISPIAAESFSLDPESYARLMVRAANLFRG